MAPLPTKNKVNRLDWNIPITNPNGTPTDEFMRKWLQQASQNGGVANLSTAAGVSAVLDLISAVKGSLLVRGATAWGALTPPPDATMFLNGAATPTFAKVKDTDLSMTAASAVNDVSITTHGFAPILPNDATKFLNGAGAYTVPAGGGAPSSAMDDGTNFYLAMQDGAGQLILDVFGDPIWALELLPASAIPPLKGVTDGSDAAPGVVGEYIFSNIARGAGPVLANGVTANITSISLTAGDWNLTAVAAASPATSIIQLSGAISQVSITLPPFPTNGLSLLLQGVTYTGDAFCTPAGRISLAATTTIYLVTQVFFTGATTGYGFIGARRAR